VSCLGRVAEKENGTGLPCRKSGTSEKGNIVTRGGREALNKSLQNKKKKGRGLKDMRGVVVMCERKNLKLSAAGSLRGRGGAQFKGRKRKDGGGIVISPDC